MRVYVAGSLTDVEAVRVGVLGDRDQSVFLRHPAVEQVRDVAAWLASARPEDDG